MSNSSLPTDSYADKRVLYWLPEWTLFLFAELTIDPVGIEFLP